MVTTDADLLRIVTESKDLKTACKQLIDAAIKRSHRLYRPTPEAEEEAATREAAANSGEKAGVRNGARSRANGRSEMNANISEEEIDV